MEKGQLITLLREKRELTFYTTLVQDDPAILSLFFDLLEREKSAVRYLCEKTVRQLSVQSPALLYPYFDRMAALLDSPNNFIKWGFILSVVNMLPVDCEDKWKGIECKYLSFFSAREIPAFGNAVKSLPKLLNVHPELEGQIVPGLLGIDGHVFYHKGQPSQECLNVAKEHIIECFLEIYGSSAYQKEMLKFARDNLENPRAGVRSRAKRFLKAYES